jgi:uncharacterized membrane protein
MNKTLRLVFLASLVLNIILLGVLLGRLPLSGGEPPSRRQRMEQELKKLPEPAQSRIREKFQTIRSAGDSLRAQLDEARVEALRIFSSEPFDEAAYDQQIKKIDGLRGEMFRRMDRAVKQATKELSTDERRLFADVLRRPPPPPA